MKRIFTFLLACAVGMAAAVQAQTQQWTNMATGVDLSDGSWTKTVEADGSTAYVQQVPPSKAGEQNVNLNIAFDLADADGLEVVSGLSLGYLYQGTELVNSSIKFTKGQVTTLSVAPGTYDLWFVFDLNDAASKKFKAQRAYDVIEGIAVTGDTTIVASVKNCTHHVAFDLTFPDGTRCNDGVYDRDANAYTTPYNYKSIMVNGIFRAANNVKGGYVRMFNAINETYTQNGDTAAYFGAGVIASDMSDNYGLYLTGYVQLADGTPAAFGMGQTGFDKDVTLAVKASDYTRLDVQMQSSALGATYEQTGFGCFARFASGGPGFTTKETRTAGVMDRTLYAALSDATISKEKGLLFNFYPVALDYRSKPAPQASDMDWLLYGFGMNLEDGKAVAKINPAMSYEASQVGLPIGDGVMLNVVKHPNYLRGTRQIISATVSYRGLTGDHCETYNSVATHAYLKSGNDVKYDGAIGSLSNLTLAKSAKTPVTYTFTDTAFVTGDLTGTNVTVENIAVPTAADNAAPTPTMLMLRDGEGGTITRRFADETAAVLLLTAADFTYALSTRTYSIAKADSVVVSYAPNGTAEWTKLNLTEDAESYTDDYGYLYKARLNQITKESANKWYDLKIELYDAAGNSHVQTLSPFVRINELVGSSSVSTPDAAKTVAAKAYYNLLGHKSATPFSGVNIVVTSFADGTTATSKVIVK